MNNQIKTPNECNLVEQGLCNKLFHLRQNNIYQELKLIEDLKHQAMIEQIVDEYEFNRVEYLADRLERINKLRQDLEARLRDLKWDDRRI